MGNKVTNYNPPSIPTKHLTPEFILSLPSMKGKIVAITGASTERGLGFICAKTLALKGARIILLNRPSERATAAENKLRELVPGVEVSTISCDLMSFESVKSASAALTSQLGGVGLDVLCNNAGVMALPDQATTDGI